MGNRDDGLVFEWDSDEPIGELIKRVRIGRGKSQYALADKLGWLAGNSSVTREYVSRWESGKRIPVPYWREYLGKALGIPIDVLDRAAAVSAAQRSDYESLCPCRRRRQQAMIEFSVQVRQLMAERRVSLRKLAKITHYDISYLSRVVNAHQPPSRQLAESIDKALEADGRLAELGQDAPPSWANR